MKNEDVRLFVAEFWGLKKEDATEALRFNNEDIKNFTSIKFYRFIASLEDNLKIKVNNIERIVDLKTLEENVVE